MKKLLFATAIAASAAAFADGPINDTAFANAGEYNPNDAGSYFYFAGASDSSMVTNTSPSTEKHTAYYATADDENYLALDTEGGTLWRSLAEIGITTDSGTNIYSLGTAQAVAAAGTYLDTLVQFTVTEDEAPEVTAGDKLAIWLQAGEGTTNLMVKANLYDFNEAPEATATSFVLAASEGTVTINPGDWYRLTVKAIPNVMNTDENGIIPGFEIYVDGIQMRATTPQFTAGMVTMMTEMEVLSETASAAIAANKLFPSLDTMGAQGDTPTLQGVGFQGTGAIDEIVWTEENPFPAAPAVVEFTLTGGANAAVSYAIGSGESQPWDGTSTISVDSGATVTFTATPTNNFTYAGVTVDGWTVSGDSLVYTTNATENVELAVPNAVAITYTLTVPTFANATLTSPASLTGIAPGTTVTLEWTAAEGYTFPNGSKTMTKEVTVNSDLTIDVSDVESSLSKETFTVTITDIENATIAATTNNTDLVDALSENAITNKYTVEYGATVTVTATAAEGYEYATAPGGWTLTEGVLSITTNVTADVELTAPVPTAVLATVTVTVTGGANARAAWTVAGESVASAPDTLTEGQTWSVTLTAVEGYEFDGTETYSTNGVAGAVDFSIALPDAKAVAEEEDWVDNPATEITAGDTAATAYPGLAGSALATADAQKLTVWAKENNIAYSDIKADTTGTHTEAYLLNCTVANVATEKEAFVANITIGANGTPVVTAPAGKSYNGKLQLKAKVNLTDATWTNVEAASTTYKFYMYELSL